MANIGELAGKITLDGSQAIAALNSITSLLGAGLGIAGIGLTLAGLKDLGETAERAGDLADGMAKNFGNVSQTLDILRSSVGGAVSDLQLMQGANELAIKGITTNANAIAGVYQTAQVRAIELGTSTQEEFDKIQAAILRPQMLRRLYSDIPEALQKTADGMDLASTRAEALRFVIEKGQTAIDAFKNAGVDIVDPYERFNATMQNLKTALGLAIAPLLVKVAQLITAVAIAVIGFIQKNKEAINSVINFGIAIVNLIGALTGLNETFGDSQSGMKGLYDQADNLFKNINTGALKGSDSMNQLAGSTKKLRDEIAQENYEYNKSLNDIVTRRQDAIAKNKEALEKQTADFQRSQLTEKKQSEQKTAELKAQLNQRLKDLQTNMNSILVVGSSTYDRDLAKYKEIIAKEKAETQKKIQEQEDLFKDQTANAQKQFDDQTKALRDSIKEDEEFLKKHADTVKTINKSMLLDEIDELKKSHAQRLETIRQSNSNVSNATLSSYKSMVDNIDKLTAGIKPINLKWNVNPEESIKTIGAGLVKIYAGLVKISFSMLYELSGFLVNNLLNIIPNLFNKLLDKALGLTKSLGLDKLFGLDMSKGNEIMKSSLSSFATNLKNSFNFLMSGSSKQIFSTINSLQGGLLDSLGLKGFANGTNYASGGLALVGERGPELVNLPRGSQVVPNDEISNYTNKSITVNNYIDKGFDVDALNNRLNFMLRTL